ncbi:hypothetical protein [Brevibacillus sp. SYSU BS000544]|uniref:hypothetical protein n=1 Tax=Brevibacillus sp. SYSU BS000544 TaxID=3416443 RepID=UPI003CE4DA13
MKNKKVVLSVLSAAVVSSMATSAFAAPSAGVYLGGDVDKYYKMENFINDAFIDAFAAQLENVEPSELVYVTEEGTAITLQGIIENDDWEAALEEINDDNVADFFGEDVSDEFTVVGEDGEDTDETVTPGTGEVDGPVVGDVAEEVEGKVVTISGTVENADDVRVTLIDKDGKTYEHTASEGQVDLDEEGAFTFTSGDLAEGDWKYEVVAISGEDESEATEGDFKIEAPAALTVESVDAINLIQADVKFNNALDATTAADTNNYTITGGLTVQDATLLEDQKTVRLTFNAAATQSAKLDVTVKDVKDAKGTEVADTTKSVTFTDATVPTVVKAQQVGPSVVRVFLSEPVKDANGLLVADNFSVDNGNYVVTNAVANTVGGYVDVTVGVPFSVGSHTVTVNPTVASDLSDYAGYEVLKADATFNAATDATVPTVAVKTATETSVTLKFSEPVTGVNGANVYFRHSYNSSTYQHLGNDPLFATPNADNTEWTLDFSDKPFPAGNVPLYIGYTSDLGAKIVDSSNNALAPVQLTMAVTQDTAKPVVSSLTVVNNTTLKVVYSEAVTTATANAQANYALTKGAVTVNPATAILGADNKTVDLTFAAPLSGNYTLQVKNIKDRSVTGNVLDTASLAVAVGDTIRPTANATAIFSDNTKKIKVTFDEEMATSGDGSITNKANYQVNTNGLGLRALGASDTITVSEDKKSAIITLSTTDTIDNTDTVVIGPVKDTTGNVLTGFTKTYTGMDLVAEAAPTLASAQLTSANQIKLTFNEVLSSASAQGIYVVDGTAADLLAPLAGVTVESVGKDAITGNSVVTLRLSANLSPDALSAGNDIEVHFNNATGIKAEFGTGIANTVVSPAADGTVVADKVAPSVAGVVVDNATQITVTFSEDLDPNTFASGATSLNGFSLTGATTVTRAVYSGARVVTITGTGFAAGVTKVNYSNTAGITDANGNKLESFSNR